jgi:hypothetical protein
MLGSPDNPAVQVRSADRFAPPPTDDECLLRLVAAVETHHAEKLAEVAGLIGRLAVTIE